MTPAAGPPPRPPRVYARSSLVYVLGATYTVCFCSRFTAPFCSVYELVHNLYVTAFAAERSKLPVGPCQSHASTSVYTSLPATFARRITSRFAHQRILQKFRDNDEICCLNLHAKNKIATRKCKSPAAFYRCNDCRACRGHTAWLAAVPVPLKSNMSSPQSSEFRPRRLPTAVFGGCQIHGPRSSHIPTVSLSNHSLDILCWYCVTEDEITRRPVSPPSTQLPPVLRPVRLNGVLARPLAGSSLVSWSVRLVHVCNLGNKRVVRVGVCQHRADGQKN